MVLSRFCFPEGFDKDLRMLVFSMASRRVALGFTFLVRPTYFALLGFSPTVIGILLSLATFVAALRHITFGLLSDRYGRKLFLLLGSVCATTRLIIFAISTDIRLLAVGQGIGALGEGSGAGQPVVSGYITEKTSEAQRSSVFTTLGVTNALATVVGFLMSGLPAFFRSSIGVNLIQGHSWLWWIGAIASIGSILLVIPIREVKHLRKEDQHKKENFMGVRSWAVIARFSLVRSLSGVGWSLISSLLPLYFFLRFGVGSEVLGPIYAFSRLFTILSYLLIPKVTGYFGAIGTLVGSRVATALIATALSVTNWYPAALLLLIVFRIVAHFTVPIRQSFATTLVASEETATAVGVSNFSRMTFRTAAPTATGYMFEAVSLSLPFMLGSILIAANAALYRIFFHSKTKPNE